MTTPRFFFTTIHVYVDFTIYGIRFNSDAGYPSIRSFGNGTIFYERFVCMSQIDITHAICLHAQ